MAATKKTVKAKFNPASLSFEEQEAVVEFYLGVHPKYFIYGGLKIKVDIFNLEHDGKNYSGFKPHLKELG